MMLTPAELDTTPDTSHGRFTPAEAWATPATGGGVSPTPTTSALALRAATYIRANLAVLSGTTHLMAA